MKKNKCQVIMLATNLPIKLGTEAKYSLMLSKENYLSPFPFNNKLVGTEYVSQHLYITSNDGIKKGDWIADKDGIYQFNNTSAKQFFEKGGYKKIIATTNLELHKTNIAKIGLPFIEKYITEYNKGNVIKEVLVEYERTFDNNSTSTFNPLKEYKVRDLPPVNKPKLRPDGTIIIHKIQEVFTKEDMKNVWINAKILDLSNFTTFDDWFEQNY